MRVLSLNHVVAKMLGAGLQSHRKARARASLALDAHRTAVQLDQLFDQRQADAGAALLATGRLNAAEALKDIRLLTLGNAGAGVSDGNLDAAFFVPQLHGNHAAPLGKLYGVAKKVGQHHLQLLAVPQKRSRRRTVRQIQLEL